MLGVASVVQSDQLPMWAGTKLAYFYKLRMCPQGEEAGHTSLELHSSFSVILLVPLQKPRNGGTNLNLTGR